MYAVITTGGKQRRVALGSRCRVEKINYDLNETVKFEEVLLVHDGADAHIGAPFVKKSYSFSYSC